MKVLVRTDASVTIGTGHAMRCLALAQALVDAGHQVVLATAQLGQPLERRYQAESVKVVRLEPSASAADLGQVSALADRLAADRLVVDGYQFDAAYLAGIARLGHTLLVDDRGMAQVGNDLVLNQNAYATADAYPSRSLDTELLLGPRFALLRREFARGQPERRVREHVERVLISLGGSDPGDATRRVLQGLGGRVAELRVIVGPLHPDRRRLADEVSATRGTVIADVTDMPEQLAWADLVIGAAGTSALEYAWAGLPAVLVVAADNQAPVARSLELAGAAVSIGRPDGSVVERLRAALGSVARHADRQRMSAAGQRLVDGAGARRTAARLAEPMRLRPATEGDAALLFEWVNDTEVRSASFTTAPIAWEEHLAWLRTRLADSQSRIYMAELDGRPVGVVRFALDDGHAAISVSVAPPARGRGIGERLIALASHRLLAETDVISVDAWVRPGNAASIGSFLAAGFVQRARRETPAGVPPEALLLTYESAGRG